MLPPTERDTRHFPEASEAQRRRTLAVRSVNQHYSAMDYTGTCHSCGTTLKYVSQPGRRESCPSCTRDVKCCKNCTFFDLTAYNYCREPQADRVVDKEASNYCDYFTLSGTAHRPEQTKKPSLSDLDDLFKK